MFVLAPLRTWSRRVSDRCPRAADVEPLVLSRISLGEAGELGRGPCCTGKKRNPFAHPASRSLLSDTTCRSIDRAGPGTDPAGSGGPQPTTSGVHASGRRSYRQEFRKYQIQLSGCGGGERDQVNPGLRENSLEARLVQIDERPFVKANAIRPVAPRPLVQRQRD
jgi:hypothetical protein